MQFESFRLSIGDRNVGAFTARIRVTMLLARLLSATAARAAASATRKPSRLGISTPPGPSSPSITMRAAKQAAVTPK